MSSTRTVRIYNNIFANNLKDIIVKNSPTADIYNNLFYESQTHSIRVQSSAVGTNGIIKNNIFWGVVEGYTLLLDSGGSALASIAEMDYNWHNNTTTNIGSFEGSIWSLSELQANTTFGDNSVTYSSDPFTDKANSNWTYIAVSADGIDEGVSISAVFTIDKDQFTRPSGSGWDIGPYEFAAESAWYLTHDPSVSGGRLE
jgi:hypothetical protein